MKRWKVQQLKYKKGYGNLSFRSYFVPQGRVLPILWPLRGGSAGKGDLFQLQVHERVASPTVEVYERVGTSVISVILSTPGGAYSLQWSKRGGSARKGDLFSGVRYMKGWEDQQLKSVEG